jgi:hypothetical protein
MFMMLLPWGLRNHALFGDGWLRMTTLEGISLYEAVYPEADGGPRQQLIKTPLEMAAMNEAERNDEWARRGWAYIREDPVRIAKLAMIKIGRTWSPWLNAADFRLGAVQVAMSIWYIPLYILGLIGVFAGVIPRRHAVLLLIPVVYFTGVHALFLGSVRDRVPLMPIVCVFAAAGMVGIGKWLSRGKRIEPQRV